MIAQELAKVEKKLNRLFDDVEVDALWYEDGKKIETVFTSTEHDPSVGVRGGELFRLVWEPVVHGEVGDAVVFTERWEADEDDWREVIQRNMGAMSKSVTHAFRAILEP